MTALAGRRPRSSFAGRPGSIASAAAAWRRSRRSVCQGRRVSWLPSTAQRAKQIGDRGAVRVQRSDARATRLEQAALGVEHVELARDAVLVAQAGEARGLGERRGARRLGVVGFAGARLRDECGAHLAERRADRLLVLRERSTLARLGLVGARSEPAAAEDRLGNAGGDRPEERRT